MRMVRPIILGVGIVAGASAWAPAFVGVGRPDVPRSAAPRAPRPIARRRHVLLSSATDLYNGTATLDGSVAGGAASPSPPKPLGTSGDWAAYLDESKGLIYYFNQITGESKWEPPAEADFSGVQMKIGASKKVEMRERLKNYLEERLNDSASEFMGALEEESEELDQNKQMSEVKVRKEKKPKLEPTKKAKETNGKDLVSEWGQWQALIDSKRGQIYYYNKKSRESSWERPDGFPDFKLSASKRISLEEQNRRYLEWNGGVEEPRSTDSAETPEPAVEAKSSFFIDKGPKDELNGGASIAPEKPDTNQLPTLPIVQQGDWSAYFDTRSGLVFYYEETSGKTSWDPPYVDFPRIVMESTGPRVLDPGSGNISMERALGYIGVDEMAEALAWEEAKKKERARKAAKRAREAKAKEQAETSFAESDPEAVEIYETAKAAEVERIEQERKFAEEQKAKEAAAAKLAEQEKERLKQERIAAEKAEAKEREAAAKRAIEEKLEQERLEQEQRERLEAAKSKETESEMKQPVQPKEDPIFTLAPVKSDNLYEILQCSSTASRTELKRAYLSLAKETHPDALIQNGIVIDANAELRFVEISQAWKILGDPTTRRRYDRELQAKGISSKAGNLFENWVMGAAKAMDEALAKAESDLEAGMGKKP